MPNPSGTQTGREVFGTFIDIAGINGATEAAPVTFPGEVKGLALSAPGAGAADDQRQRAPSGNIRTIPTDATTQQKTLTLTIDVAAHLLDYQAIVDLEGKTIELMVRQRRLELPVADETAAGTTIEIPVAWEPPVFAGNAHPSKIAKGMAVQIANKDHVIRELQGKGNSVDLSESLDELTVLFDKQGDVGGTYTKGTDLAAAVAANPYVIVWPATSTGFFAVTVISAPPIGDFSSGERGQVTTATVVLELVEINVPFERIMNLPTVVAA